MQKTLSKSHNAIDVSFAVASYNSSEFLEEAVLSALSQNEVSVEVIIVDDGSSDGSKALALKLAKADDRVKVLCTEKNSGPAGARNLALRTMRGKWYAVLDSDDLIKPERSARLIKIAEVQKADLIADDLEIFGEGVINTRLFGNSIGPEPFIVSIEQYFRKSRLFSKKPGYGFLKPMIKREVLLSGNLSYDESLRVGEDDELIIRLLAAGNRYLLHNQAMYLYRKHTQSISHRLSVENAQKMLLTEAKVQKLIGPRIASGKEYQARLRSIKRGLAFVSSVEYLKKKQVLEALRIVLANPSSIFLYKMPLHAWIKKKLQR